jgi:hypothetical protein
MEPTEITYGMHPQIKGLVTEMSESGGWGFSGHDGRKAYHMRNFQWIKEGHVAFTFVGVPRVYIVDDRKNDKWGRFTMVKPGDYVFVERPPGEGKLIRMGGWDTPKKEIRPITREGLMLLLGREARPADMITYDELDMLGMRWNPRAVSKYVSITRDWGILSYSSEFDCPCIDFRNGSPFLIGNWGLYELNMGKKKGERNGQMVDDIQKYLVLDVESEDEDLLPEEIPFTTFFRDNNLWLPEEGMKDTG